MAKPANPYKRKKEGFHEHDGYLGQHSVEIKHNNATAKAAHGLEVASHKRAENRTNIRSDWKKEDQSKGKGVRRVFDTQKYDDKGEIRKYSTMSDKAHENFKAIYSKLIAEHQEKHGIKNPEKVRKGFHAIAMPTAWRKFKGPADNPLHEKDSKGIWQPTGSKQKPVNKHAIPRKKSKK